MPSLCSYRVYTCRKLVVTARVTAVNVGTSPLWSEEDRKQGHVIRTFGTRCACSWRPLVDASDAFPEAPPHSRTSRSEHSSAQIQEINARAREAA